MTEKANTGQTRRTQKPGAASDRDARLKSALKANMAKRKAQARKRAAAPDQGRDEDA
jgi:hypothetical protein